MSGLDFRTAYQRRRVVRWGDVDVSLIDLADLKDNERAVGSEARTVKTKTVYLLGAGFSKPAGMPLATEVLPLLMKSGRKDDSQDDDRDDEMTAWLADLQKRVEWLEGGGSGHRGLNIEEVFHLGHFDAEVHRLKQQLCPVGRSSGETPWQTAEDIEGWLSYLEEALVDVLVQKESEARESKANLDQITRWARTVCEADTVVTFNYDTLVERAFEALDRHWNHGFKLENGAGVTVFELHGSIDWIVADRDAQLAKCELLFDKPNANRSNVRTGHVEDDCRLWRCRDRRQIRAWINGHHIQKLRQGAWPTTPGVAGLGAHKELHRVPGLGRTWAGAMRAVRDADQLVVVGFSMSDFDTMARLQLSYVARTRHEEEPPLPVIVIDPAADCSPFQARFTRVFHDGVRFVRKSHEQFNWGTLRKTAVD